MSADSASTTDRGLRDYSLLVRKTQGQALRTAFSLLGDHQYAEDAVQEAYLYAWQHLDELRVPGAFRGWLNRIVRTQCDRISRRAGFRVSEPVDQVDESAQPDRVVQRIQYQNQLLVALQQMQSQLATTFSLFYLSEYSVREVSVLLEINPGTVRKRLHDARKILQQVLTQENITMSKKEMDESLTTRSDGLETRIIKLLEATLSGDASSVRAILEEDRSLAGRSGPHPIWGGNPQPLHVAAERDQIAIAQQLLDSGADVNGGDADYDGWSPLMLAAHGGRLGLHTPRLAIVDLLIAQGAEVDIHAAALLDDIDRVTALVDSDSSLVNEVGPADATPLHFARSEAMCQLLLSRGAIVDAVCGWGTTPLERLSFQGDSQRSLADLLISNGAEPNACILAGIGDTARLKVMLDENPSLLEERNKVAPSVTGTPLHAAAQHGQDAVAELLLGLGADVNARADMGQTPLHLSTYSLAVTRLLVESGADVSAQDDEHGTAPVDWAQFFHSNLEPDNDEVRRVLDYLEGIQ